MVEHLPAVLESTGFLNPIKFCLSKESKPMTDQTKRKRFAEGALCAAVFVLSTLSAHAQIDVSNLQVPAESVMDVPPPVGLRTGDVELWVQLVDSPLAVALGQNAKKQAAKLDSAQQRRYLQQLRQKQDSLMVQISSLGGRELARVSKGHNAIAIAIDGSKVPALAALPDVKTVRRV